MPMNKSNPGNPNANFHSQNRKKTSIARGLEVEGSGSGGYRIYLGGVHTPPDAQPETSIRLERSDADHGRVCEAEEKI